MSQQTLTVREASRTVTRAGLQWWSLTLETETDAADGVVTQLIAPLSSRSSALGARRWYFDAARSAARRTTIRVRVLGRAAVIEQCRAELQELLRDSGVSLLSLDERIDPEIKGQRTISSAECPRGAEKLAFGGAEGLELAEDLFQLASEIAVYARRRFSSEPGRCAFAALLLADTASATMFGRYADVWNERADLSPEGYWSMHVRSCFPGEAGMTAEAISRYQQAFERKTAAFHPIMRAVSSEPNVNVLRKRWHRAVDLYLQRCYRAHICRSAGQLAQQHIHLLLQRAGLSAKEEAVAGGYARTWTAPLTERA